MRSFYSFPFFSTRSVHCDPQQRWRMLATLPLLALLAALQSTGWSQDAYPQGAPLDPPGQVAWLNLAQGTVSFAAADAAATAGMGDANAWTSTDPNRPLTRGDQLLTGPQARAELHAGSTAVRLGEDTRLEFSALGDGLVQLRLAQGTLGLRVRALFDGQRLEIDTPNLAFMISQPGDYRLDVDPTAGTTRLVAQSGSGVIYGDGGVSLALGSPLQGTFSGTRLTAAAPGPALQDGFDAWSAERDRREDESVSARYVPRETVGYQQLDSYGDWQQDATYGAVWLPRAVPADWAPYRAGRWSWISPWGWTWIDDAPWGFAPFHYGRWTQIGPRWAWAPGRLPARPVYAPALVAFVGGADPGGAARPALGWFPLAPGEAFRPAYRASSSYIGRLNQNIPLNSAANLGAGYRYQRQPGAVTALSRDDFVRGLPIQRLRQVPSAADLSGARVLLDQGAMPQRPARSDPPERYRPAPTVPGALAVQPPAVRVTPFSAPGRTAFDAEQRARREQQLLQRGQERQQQQQLQLDSLRQQHELQRRQGDAALQQQRALREQAYRQQAQQRAAAPEPASRPQAQDRQQPRPPESAHRRGQGPDGGPHHHR